MNLALRKGTKAGIIDAAQHDAIMEQAPKAAPARKRLDPESMHYLTTWQQFGSPVAGGMMGVMDLRAMQTVGRDAWLEREVIAYGDDPEPYRTIWGALDDWVYQTAVKAASGGGDDG